MSRLIANDMIVQNGRNVPICPLCAQLLDSSDNSQHGLYGTNRPYYLIHHVCAQKEALRLSGGMSDFLQPDEMSDSDAFILMVLECPDCVVYPGLLDSSPNENDYLIWVDCFTIAACSPH